MAGLLIEKFAYHLLLYRQNQRLADAGVRVTRPRLTQVVHWGAGLLASVYEEAQFASIRQSRPTVVEDAFHGRYPDQGRRGEPGKMKAALGLSPTEGAVLLPDGDSAYAHYAKETGITHAQCRAHTRRLVFEAQSTEPKASAEALDMIGALYQVDADIRARQAKAAHKLDHRLIHAKPIVERFFAWVNRQFEAEGLLPSSPLTKALAYARKRRCGLEVYLHDADVPIDTNHPERALGAVPIGGKNWLFHWSEVGAKYAGIVHSLIVTCKLNDIDPHDYLVDVLQKVGQHPASKVDELTPRLWKQQLRREPAAIGTAQVGGRVNDAGGLPVTIERLSTNNAASWLLRLV